MRGASATSGSSPRTARRPEPDGERFPPLQPIFARGRYCPAVQPREQFKGILAAARTGEEWAVAVLYREFQPMLLRYLRMLEAGEGEDLASETWADVAAGLSRFRGDEQAFARWLFTIARRRLIDLQRRRGRAISAASQLKALEACESAEGAALARSETELALARLAALPRGQAEVILLRVVAGLRVSDVAEILGKKAGTVRVLQHRGLKRLAEELSRERRAVTQ
jgi:RNA polymerase sigma-70 factor, ECF subfamily